MYVICNECGMHFTLESSTRVNSDYIGSRWTVNVGAVWGQMATGGGSGHLNESRAIGEVRNTTKKILFMGVENKYCSVCSIAERRQQPPTNISATKIGALL